MHWSPAKGDRFVVPDRDLDDEVFVVSDMVVEAVDVPSGGADPRLQRHHRVGARQPRGGRGDLAAARGPARGLLGDAFVSLERLDTEPAGYAVTVRVGGEPVRHVDVDAESALARALLELLN